MSIGNADAHGKNISLLHTQPGSVALAPLYDTVPTVMWPALRDRTAMSIGAAIDLGDITFEDLMNEVKRWGLSDLYAHEALTQTLEKIVAACDMVTDSGNLPISRAVKERAKKLLT